MINREKVIKGLECCREMNGYACQKCPYIDDCDNMLVAGIPHLASDALELLKEQAILVDTKVIGTEHGDIEVYCCRACRYRLDPTFHFCPNCGKEVIWND